MVHGGSPPRARGRRCGPVPGLRDLRFTPAGAGTASAGTRPATARTVHPRGRGDGPSFVPGPGAYPGSPPRARGRRSSGGACGSSSRFTPAGAGTAPVRPRRTGPRSVHPRGRGDGDAWSARELERRGSPPRARGRPLPSSGSRASSRFTPAGAGTARAGPARPGRTPVHPRGRGDGGWGCRVMLDAIGSPPRARGRPGRPHERRGEQRFTPAGAGTAKAGGTRACGPPVHPRGRGDGPPSGPLCSTSCGSPPRARGRPLALGVVGLAERFTPAGAGTAARRRASGSGAAVHPRGRGDGARDRRAPRPSPVHPRGRGDGATTATARSRSSGSPPRARGRPGARGRGRCKSRFTPAGAGTAGAGAPRRRRGAVHPRGRGDGCSAPKIASSTIGSPPRARGRPGRPDGLAPLGRFTPAGAGTACASPTWPTSSAVHPRGRGDGVWAPRQKGAIVGSPPRARGRPLVLQDARVVLRFTPAGAGTACGRRARRGRSSVHPRGRGDGHAISTGPTPSCGSPPRARGRPRP